MTIAYLNGSTPDDEKKAERMAALMGNIARSIMDSGELDEAPGWVEFSAIFRFAGDSVTGSYGYAYDEEGEDFAVAFLYDEVMGAVAAYRDFMTVEGKRGCIKMLFQFNRETSRAHSEFEYDDPARWKVTPANLAEIVAQLRPKLGETR